MRHKIQQILDDQSVKNVKKTVDIFDEDLIAYLNDQNLTSQVSIADLTSVRDSLSNDIDMFDVDSIMTSCCIKRSKCC